MVMKKTLASLLIMVFVVGMLGAAAEQESAAVVKEFSSSEAVVAAGGFVTTKDVRAYDVSAHVPVEAEVKSEISTGESDVDASGFQCLNQWIYSPEKREDGASIFVLWAQKSADGNGQFFYIQTIPVDWEGWKLVSLPLENFVRRNSKGEDGTYSIKLTDDPSILQEPKTLYYGVNAYLNEGIVPVTEWTSAGYFCLDNVWLANDQSSPFDPVQSEAHKHFPVQTFDDVGQLGSGSNATVQVVNDPVREGSQASMRFEVSTGDVFIETKNLNFYTENYEYLYTWIYSPKKQDNGATINFQFYNVGNTAIGLYSIPVNWEGWKLVVVPLENIHMVKGNVKDLWKLRAIRVNVNGYVGRAGITKWEEDSYFCLDSMWLSSSFDECQDQIPDTQVIREFSGEEAITPIEGLAADTQHTRGYTMSARMDIPKSVSDSGGRQEKTVAIKGIGGTSYGYTALNQWIYSPSADNGGATINVLWIADNAANSGMYYIQTVPVDWEGWKMVSLPLDGFIRRNDAAKLSADQTAIQGLNSIYYNVTGYRGEHGQMDWAKDSYVCLDNIWLGKTANPVWDSSLQLTSQQATIEGDAITGFDGMSVEMLMRLVVLPQGATAAAYTPEGERAQMEKPVEQGMQLAVTNAGRTMWYTLYPNYYVDSISTEIDGEVVADGNLKVGTLEGSVTLSAYESPISVILAAVQYDENGRVMQVSLGDSIQAAKGETKEATVSMQITKPEGTQVKVLALKSFESLQPVGSCAVLTAQ